MRVGTVKEIKNGETRVGITPEGAAEIVRAGHIVYVEAGCGEGSGFGDDDYRSGGAVVCKSADEVWSNSDMVVKVKEILPPEYPMLRERQILIAFLHLAEDYNRAMLKALLSARTCALALEQIVLPDGTRPAIVPMSEIAGYLAAVTAAQLLQRTHGGPGLVLGNVSGVLPVRAVVLGGGIVGQTAARTLAGLGADVVLFEVNHSVLRKLSGLMPPNVKVVYSNAFDLKHALRECRVLINAIYPKPDQRVVVSREMVRSMPEGSVLIDVGGSTTVETSHYTTLSDPVYVEEGVLHYCVDNTPALVPKTSTPALANVTLPIILALAERGLQETLRQDRSLRNALVTYDGELVNEEVAMRQGFEDWHAVNW